MTKEGGGWTNGAKEGGRWSSFGGEKTLGYTILDILFHIPFCAFIP